MTRPLVLKSGIHKNFKKNFELDEDSTHRITGILEKAAKEIGSPTTIVYYVYRKDYRFYETTKLENIFNDANISGKEICIFRIELRNTDPTRKPEPWEDDWIVAVIFDTDEKDQVQLRIYSEKTNWALLLADELEPQIERTFKPNAIPDWILLPLYWSLVFLGFKWINILFSNGIFPGGVIYSLQALIIILSLFISFFTVSKGKLRSKWLTKYLGPESVFLWGDQREKYFERKQTRKSIFWSVIVGFLISIAANIITSISLF